MEYLARDFFKSILTQRPAVNKKLCAERYGVFFFNGIILIIIIHLVRPKPMKRLFFLLILLNVQLIDFSQEVKYASATNASAWMKWGLVGLILIAFFSLLVIIAKVFRRASSGRSNNSQYLHDSALYTTDNAFASNDSSSAESSSSDFGGGDSGGAGASDNW